MMKYALIISSALLATTSTRAACVKVTSVNALSQQAVDAGYTAASWIGVGDTDVQGNLGLPGIISLSKGSGFQPEGTLLGSSISSFVPNGRTAGISANQIMFRCDISDIGAVYEYYATNGDDPWGGNVVVPGIEGAYYTYVKNVGVRLTNLKTGEYYSRYWKSRVIPENEMYNDGTYIYIPASAFSDVQIELFKVDAAARGADGSNRYGYIYPGPAGYIAFHGGGMSPALYDNADSASIYSGWSGGSASHWPGGWSLTKQTMFTRGAACRISDYPATVAIPTMSIAELNNNGRSQAAFNVSVECENGAVSGIQTSTATAAYVAMGFMINNATAARAANELGLTTGAGAYTWLLDNNYGTNGVASGVGIRIYSDKLAGQPLNLLPALSAIGTGHDGGWYGYQELTDSISSDTTDLYSGNFTASLEAITNETVTSGSVYAQLQVVVSFQ